MCNPCCEQTSEWPYLWKRGKKWNVPVAAAGFGVDVAGCWVHWGQQSFSEALSSLTRCAPTLLRPCGFQTALTTATCLWRGREGEGGNAVTHILLDLCCNRVPSPLLRIWITDMCAVGAGLLLTVLSSVKCVGMRDAYLGEFVSGENRKWYLRWYCSRGFLIIFLHPMLLSRIACSISKDQIHS